MKITPKLINGILIRGLILAFFLATLVGFIAFARGYRFNFQDGTVTSTGILSINSSPRPAKVYIDGVLKGVTDLNLTLPHGKYTVEIKKDGYTDLKKTINLKGEIVMSINALLFPKNPSLSPLTNLGIVKAIPVSGTDRIILFTDNNDPEKDGIYLFESTKKTISIFPPLKLLLLKTLLPAGVDIKDADVYFSPDNREGIVTFMSDEVEYSYLLSLEDVNEDLFDVTESKETVIAAWQDKKEQNLLKIIETFQPEIRKIASDSFRVVAFSPDETKILYQAKQNATVPKIIEPALIGANQTSEVRTIEQDKLYVYDRKEDKNFVLNVPINVNELVANENQPVTEMPNVIAIDDELRDHIHGFLRWFPDSSHLVIKDDNEIDIMSYDGTNRITVYSGPFQKEFYAIAPDWNLLILANLNPQNNEFGDLYSIGIR